MKNFKISLNGKLKLINGFFLIMKVSFTQFHKLTNLILSLIQQFPIYKLELNYQSNF